MSYDVFTKDGKPAGTLTAARRGSRTVFEFQSDTDPGVSRLVLITDAAPLSLGIPCQRAGGLYLQRTMTRLELGGAELSDGLTALLIPAGENYSALTGPAAPETSPSPAPDAADASPENREECREAAPSAPEENTAEACAPEAPPSDPQPPTQTQEKAPAPGDGRAGEPGDGWRREPDPGRYFNNAELRRSASRCQDALVRDTEDGVILAFPWTADAPFPMLEIFRLCSSATIRGAEYICYRLKGGDPV